MYPPHGAYPKGSEPQQQMVSPPSQPPPDFQSVPVGIPVVNTLPVQTQPEVPWHTDLCACGEDCSNCCITCWCPCITFGKIAEIADEGRSSCASCGTLYAIVQVLTGLACFYSCHYRTKLRRKFNLRQSPCPDCLVHCFCETCALCQEYRELKFQGYNMDIGWQTDDERRHGATLPPRVPPGMRR